MVAVYPQYMRNPVRNLFAARADDDDAHLPAHQAFQILFEHGAEAHVQSFERIVENEELRIFEQCPCDGDLAALAVGELQEFPVQKRLQSEITDYFFLSYREARVPILHIFVKYRDVDNEWVRVPDATFRENV